MGDFAEAAEQALPADGNDSSAAPAVPADSGTGASAPAAPEPTTPEQGPITPAAPDAASTEPKAATPAAAPVTPPADTAKMVPAPALREAREQNKALRETYGWLQRDHVPAIREFYEHYRRDPVQAVVSQLQQMLQHPVYSQQIRALMGSGTEDVEPQPDWQDENGDRVYSPAQLAKWQQWTARQSQSAIDAKLKPLQGYVEQQQQREKLTVLQQQATDRAKGLFAQLRQDPDFVQHESAIKDRYLDLVEDGMVAEAALYRAYNDVIRESVVPSLRRGAKAEVVAALNQKPGASTPNPARPGGAGAAKPKYEDFRSAAADLL